MGHGRPNQDPAAVEVLLQHRPGVDLRGGQQRQGQAVGSARRAVEGAGRRGDGDSEGAGVGQQAGSAAGRECGGGDGEARADEHPRAADVVRARLLQHHGRRAARRAGLAGLRLPPSLNHCVFSHHQAISFLISSAASGVHKCVAG